MVASTVIPARGSYTYVLRRCTPLDPHQAEAVSCYGETSKDSRDVMHHDGKRRRTIFLTTKPMRDRLVKLGWEDVTGPFHAMLDAPDDDADAGGRKASDPKTVETVEAPPAGRPGRSRTRRKRAAS